MAVLLAIMVAACGNGRSALRSVAPSSAPVSTSSSTLPGTDPPTTLPRPSTAPPPATRVEARAEASPVSGSADAAPQPPPREIDEVGDTGGATKVITVASTSWESSTATLALWERRPDGSWAQAGGPWDAHVGGGGWAYEPGEATRRSPVGSFGFGTGFGLQANPGYEGGWFGIGDTDYWVEDPVSPDYNTHQQGPVDPAKAPWGHFEHLVDYPVAYRYVVLIDFNVPPRGGIGSGIFLHESTGGSTAGCVSLPEDQLLTTLRWIDPGSTRIIMGPDSELPRL